MPKEDYTYVYRKEKGLKYSQPFLYQVIIILSAEDAQEENLKL
jgi:hypothetical protein